MLNHESLRESLAALAHDQWSKWMHHMLNKCDFNEDLTVTIPADLAARWLRQAGATYDELSEGERESDRHQADKVLAVLKQHRGEK